MEPIKAILLNYLRGQITADEQAELDAWLAASAANRELFAELNDPDRVALSLEKFGRMQEDLVWARLQAQGLEATEEGQGVPAHRAFFGRRRWWVAAAALIALLGIGSYWAFHNTRQKQIAVTWEQRFKNDIAPGKNAAILTLAGGRKIILDSAARGTISQQGSTTIINATGQLVYQIAANSKPQATSPVTYNTLTTGRGNQYQLVLPDGSRVWLNAASSITYPAAFAGAERRVAITGEAYFEIVKNPSMPFKVILPSPSGDTPPLGGWGVEVLGTHFNVNTYDDEPALKTTLLEGSVKVTKGAISSQLRPGQQAIVSGNQDPAKVGGGAIKGTPASIRVIDDPDIEEVMAWKNGAFKFNDATIESIMRQMARWYDVEVVYDTKVSQHFVADVPRDVPASELLKLLELTDQVHFKIEGKKITVTK